MITIRRSFWAIIILCSIAEALSDCSLDTLTVGNVRTGQIKGGQPEWKVTVYNNCKCPQSNIRLKCAGFQSAESIDPSLFLPQGDTCLLNNGSTLMPQASVSFAYAWYSPFLLWPTASTSIQC